MSRTTLRSVVMAALLLFSAAGAGVASASGHGGTHSAPDSDAAATASTSMHLHVHGHVDGGELVLTVSYEGNGSALVTVEGTNAAYEDGGNWTVENERELRLSAPEDPSGYVVTVETPNGEFTRTVEYESISIGCGEHAESATVPTAVTTSWSVSDGNETHSGNRTLDLPARNVDCPEEFEEAMANSSLDGMDGAPELPDSGDEDAPENDSEDSSENDSEDAPSFDLDEKRQAVYDRLNEKFEEHESNIESRLDEIGDPELPETPSPEAPDGDGAHDDAHDAEDDAHESFREGVDEANESAHGAYGQAHSEANPLLQTLLTLDPDSFSDGMLQDIRSLESDVKSAGEDAEQVKNDTEDDATAAGDHATDDAMATKEDAERDAEAVNDSATSLGGRVVDDGEGYADAAGDRASEERAEAEDEASDRREDAEAKRNETEDDGSERREEAESDVAETREEVEGGARDGYEHGREQAKESADHAREQAEESAGHATEQAEETGQYVDASPGEALVPGIYAEGEAWADAEASGEVSVDEDGAHAEGDADAEAGASGEAGVDA